MHRDPLNRRQFLTRLGLGAVAVGAVAAVQACGKKEGGGEAGATACNDMTGVPESDQATRKSLAYVDKSPHADKRCDNCLQFTAGSPCGTCKLFKGPVAAAGYCNGWVVKPA